MYVFIIQAVNRPDKYTQTHQNRHIERWLNENEKATGERIDSDLFSNIFFGTTTTTKTKSPI